MVGAAFVDEAGAAKDGPRRRTVEQRPATASRNLHLKIKEAACAPCESLASRSAPTRRRVLIVWAHWAEPLAAAQWRAVLRSQEGGAAKLGEARRAGSPTAAELGAPRAYVARGAGAFAAGAAEGSGLGHGRKLGPGSPPVVALGPYVHVSPDGNEVRDDIQAAGRGVSEARSQDRQTIFQLDAAASLQAHLPCAAAIMRGVRLFRSSVSPPPRLTAANLRVANSRKSGSFTSCRGRGRPRAGFARQLVPGRALDHRVPVQQRVGAPGLALQRPSHSCDVVGGSRRHNGRRGETDALPRGVPRRRRDGPHRGKDPFMHLGKLSGPEISRFRNLSRNGAPHMEGGYEAA